MLSPMGLHTKDPMEPNEWALNCSWILYVRLVIAEEGRTVEMLELDKNYEGWDGASTKEDVLILFRVVFPNDLVGFSVQSTTEWTAHDHLFEISKMK